MVIRDVVTQWNYTHAMIKRAILLHKVSPRYSLFTLQFLSNLSIPRIGHQLLGF